MGLKIKGNDLSNAKIAISVVNAKGPCDPGFHVPSGSNRDSIITLLKNTWGLSVSNITNYLLLPPAYYINRSTGNTINTSYGTHRLWCRSKFSQASNAPACFKLDENNKLSVDSDKGANGFNVRAFKDTVVEPDSSWTCIFGNLINGIYWNQNLKLISIVSNRDTIYTLQDRNVGATIAWVYGDTVTDDNSGYYFQRGNNHGFPRSGATEFYTTQQNPTGYGPGNWYDDSHWVKTSSNHWWSTANFNLWGQDNAMDTFTETYDVKEIYIGSNKVYPGFALVLAGKYGNVYEDSDYYYFGSSPSNIDMSVCKIWDAEPLGYHIGYVEDYYILNQYCNLMGISWKGFLDLYSYIQWQSAGPVETKSFGLNSNNWPPSYSLIESVSGYEFYQYQHPWTYNANMGLKLAFADANYDFYKVFNTLTSVAAADPFTKWIPIYMEGRMIKVTQLVNKSNSSMLSITPAALADRYVLDDPSSVPPSVNQTGGFKLNCGTDFFEITPDTSRGSNDFVMSFTQGAPIQSPTVSLRIIRVSGGYKVNYTFEGKEQGTGKLITIDSGTFSTSSNTYGYAFDTPFLRIPTGCSGSESFRGSIKILDIN